MPLLPSIWKCGHTEEGDPCGHISISPQLLHSAGCVLCLSPDSLGWKLFYVTGCLFVAVQNLEDWEVRPAPAPAPAPCGGATTGRRALGLMPTLGLQRSGFWVLELGPWVLPVCHCSWAKESSEAIFLLEALYDCFHLNSFLPSVAIAQNETRGESTPLVAILSPFRSL